MICTFCFLIPRVASSGKIVRRGVKEVGKSIRRNEKG